MKQTKKNEKVQKKHRITNAIKSSGAWLSRVSQYRSVTKLIVTEQIKKAKANHAEGEVVIDYRVIYKKKGFKSFSDFHRAYRHMQLSCGLYLCMIILPLAVFLLKPEPRWDDLLATFLVTWIGCMLYIRFAYRLWQVRVGKTYPFSRYLDAVNARLIEILPLPLNIANPID